MARHTGPKNKLSRREGTDLFNKGVKLRRMNVPPGVHGPNMRAKKMSDYGTQLREKQKIKRQYGILEKQFQRYYQMADRQPTSTGPALIMLLENRLDNILYRAGIAKTRNMARQIVVHGHVTVDGQKVDRPSYQVKDNQTIMLSEKFAQNPDVIAQLESDTEPAPWLQRQATNVKKTRNPQREEVSEDFNEQLVVEYYSR